MASNQGWTSDKILEAVADDVIITVLVGEDEKTYKMPRSVLYNASPWFRAALDPSKFLEGQSNILKFPEVDTGTFDRFVVWLYGTERDRTPEDDYWTPDPYKPYDCQSMATNLWIFAHTYIMPALQNFAMRILWLNIEEERYMDVGLIRKAFEKTPEGSELRKASVRAIHMSLVDDGVDEGMVAEEVKDFPGFVREMLAYIATHSYRSKSKGKVPEDFLIEEE
ncbi:hypothetical protein MBLNU230_g0332t1 [Neophaeotheca triangularis]